MIFLLQKITFRAIVSMEGDFAMVKNRIGVLRRENGFNQKELGEQLGVGQTTVSAWETGKNEPDSESMHKMAQLFHVSIGYLAGYENNEATRGLSQAEIRAMMDEDERKRNQDEIDRFDRQEELDRCGLSEEDIEKLEYESLISEWEQTDKSTYLQAFQINKMCDFLTENQRKRLLTVAEQMFPNAVRGEYTDEIAHK